MPHLVKQLYENQIFRFISVHLLQDIFLENPDVRWNDIIGLDSAKRLIKEAVVYPISVRKFVCLFKLNCFELYFSNYLK